MTSDQEADILRFLHKLTKIDNLTDFRNAADEAIIYRNDIADAVFPVELWKQHVALDETKMSYLEWMRQQIENF